MLALATKSPDSPLNEPKPRLSATYVKTGSGTWRPLAEVVGSVVEHLVVIEDGE